MHIFSFELLFIYHLPFAKHIPEFWKVEKLIKILTLSWRAHYFIGGTDILTVTQVEKGYIL